jgi:hypothetical protein
MVSCCACNTFGHTALLNFLIWKLGGAVGYMEHIGASCSLENQHIFSSVSFFGCTSNGAFYKSHFYDKILNIWLRVEWCTILVRFMDFEG